MSADRTWTIPTHDAVTIGTANGLSLSGQALSLALASTSATGALSSTDWNTFNGKQAALNGTGFVKISGTTISYDNSTYLTTANAASTYVALAGTQTISGDKTFTNGITSFAMYTSDETKYLVPGGVSSLLTLNLAGALSGTSATFSSLTSGYITKAGTSGLLQNSLIYDTGTRIAIGGTSATYGVLTVQSDAGQFCIQSNTTPGKQLQIGYDYTTNNSYLSSLEQGVAFTPLFLQPNGGTVGIGGLIANSADRSLLSIKQTSTAYNNGIYLERGGERNGYFMYIGGGQDSLTFRRNYFGTQSDVMSLTREGNIGFGTASPLNIANFTSLQVNGINSGLIMVSNNANIRGHLYVNAGGVQIGASSNNLVSFNTNDAEKARITSDGSFVAGATGNQPSGGELGAWLWIPSQNRAYFSSTSGACAGFNRFSNTGDIMAFNYGGGSVGSISTNGSTITFSGNALSDARHKENIKPIQNALDAVNSIDFVTFNYKENNKQKSAGVTAQQAQTVDGISDFVINGIDEDSYKAFDYNALIGYLGKAIQEQQAQIENLKKQLN